ncbi:MAG: helix-turn-helix transcriptional regulator [Nitrospirota bacterium]
MNELTDFILEKIPVGVVVFNPSLDIIYSNRQATNFLKRFEMPEEVITISRRIFKAMVTSSIIEFFPGEIYIIKRFEGSPSNWTFRVFIGEKPDSFVYIFIIEEKISNKLNMNEIRQQYRLTRRETDILRRVLDGLKNTEIAEELEISEQTVKDHLSNIYVKLGVKNRFALVRSLISSPEQ